MGQISSGSSFRGAFEGLLFIVVCTAGCLWMELVNTFTFMFKREMPYPRTTNNMWEHWDWVAKRFAQPYLEPYEQIQEVLYMTSDNIKHVRAILETRADSIRHRFEARASKWLRINIPSIEYAMARKQVRNFQGDSYYCLDTDTAKELVKLNSFLAFRTKILHEDWVKHFSSMTKGRRENSVMSAELMTCSGVVLIKFGSVVKGVLPIEHLQRMGCDHVQTTVLDTIRRDNGYKYMCDKIKEREEFNTL